jgi:hypothetical protein
VSPYGVAPIQQLSVRSQTATVRTGDPFEEVDLQSFFSWPGWGEDAAALSQVIEFCIGNYFNKLFPIHSFSYPGY